MTFSFVDISNTKFSINGRNHFKTFIPVYVDDNTIRVVNIYDSKLVLVPNIAVSEIQVDGSSYANATLLINALYYVVYTVAGSSSGIVDWGGIGGNIEDQDDLVEYVSSKVENSQRRPAVLSKASIDVAPPTENEGDRYLLYGSGTPNVGWDDQPTNTLVEFNGTSWVAETPKVGQTVYVINTNSNFQYKSSPANGWYQYFDHPLTTKGDLMVFNGSTLVRLPVGTDTQKLVADSSEASGLKWIDDSAGGIQKQFVRFFHTSLNYNTTNQWKGWNATNAYNMLFDPFSQGFSTGSTPGYGTWENVACVFLKGVKKLTKITWSKKTQTASTGLSDIEVYVVITDLDYANEQVVVSDILSTTSTDAFITELVINSHTDFSDSSCLFLFERIRSSGAQTTNVFYGVQRILEFE